MNYYIEKLARDILQVLCEAVDASMSYLKHLRSSTFKELLESV